MRPTSTREQAVNNRQATLLTMPVHVNIVGTAMGDLKLGKFLFHKRPYSFLTINALRLRTFRI